jgi:hypothetical protein
VLVVATDQDTEATGSSPACAVPDGVAHGFDPTAGTTRCGRPAAEVTVWPELTWPPSGMAAVDTCPACEAAG